MDQQPVILFDGVCNFCNRAVNFVIKRDKKQIIRFAALQTDVGARFLMHYQLPTDDFKSFLFIEHGVSYSRSTAALKVCKYLTGLWPLFYAFIFIPAFLRDPLYDWIAKNRYKWFGIKDSCMIPAPELKARFLN